MKKLYVVIATTLLSAVFVLALGVRTAHTRGPAAPDAAQVHMVITNQSFDDSREAPVLRSESLQIKVGKEKTQVEQ